MTSSRDAVLRIEEPGLFAQFILCRSGETEIADWKRLDLGGFTLFTHPALPTIPICSAEQVQVGWLLGWPVEGERLIEDVWTATAEQASVEQLGERLSQLSGRWAAVVCVADGSRLYLDALASLAAVYRTDRRIAGSTPTAVHLDELADFQARCLAEPELRANAYFLGQRTRTADTRRLLPNFYLDLLNWEPVRHWPTRPIEQVTTEDAAGRVLSAIGDTLAAVNRKYTIYHGLSAGRDTRVTLAAAHAKGVEIEWYTFGYDDPYKRDDIALASELARRLSLRHRVISLDPPTQALRDEYLLRVGYCSNSGKACDQYDACRRHVDLSQAMGIGYGGEVGRGYYWRVHIPNRRPTPQMLVDAMHLVLEDRAQTDAARNWLDTVPHFLDAPQLLDLAYWELRAGCWASPQMYGAAPVRCYFVPMADRAVLGTLMGMPLDARQTQSGIESIANAGLPEAADLPYSLPRHPSADRRSLVRRCLSKVKRTVRPLVHS